MKQLTWLYSIVLFGILILIASPGHAERRHDIHGDLVHLGAEEFTGVFVSSQRVGDDGPQQVIIDDSIYSVDKQTVFRDKGGGLISLTSFKPGTPVRFFALDALLTKMWATGEPPTEQVEKKKTIPSTEDKKPSSMLRKEKGVWKN
jgi:hypothetical protein